ncbi:TIGR04283 family arsenosugar biosynthesis glycosyltransferase [Algoriphagus namhaensis]
MKISVIIPCLNEADNLQYLIPLIHEAIGGQSCEIIVADGGSTDDTVRLAKFMGAKVLRLPQPSRAAQMNKAAAQASGEILYFVHADTRPLSNFAQLIWEALDRGADAGCFRYRFDSESTLLRINSWFTRFNGLLSGGGDQTLFIRKTFFDRLGGFDESFCVMEDFELVRRIRQKGSFHVLPEAILVSARKYENNSWLRVQLANLSAFTLFLLKVKPSTIKNLYFSLLSTKR